MSIERKLNPELCMSAQLQHTDGPPALWLDQANMENESDSPSRTI